MKIPNFNPNQFFFNQQNASQPNGLWKNTGQQVGRQNGWQPLNSQNANLLQPLQNLLNFLQQIMSQLNGLWKNAGQQAGQQNGWQPLNSQNANSGQSPKNPINFSRQNAPQPNDSSKRSAQQTRGNNPAQEVVRSQNSKDAGSTGTLQDAAAQSDVAFGAFASPELLRSNEKYADTLNREFSSVTVGNSMKWESVHPSRDEYNFGPAEEVVNFANENGKEVRGHTLVWHNQLADWAKNLKGEELGSAMDDHIAQTVGHFKGKVKTWDVVNEPVDVNGEDGYRQSPFYNELGKDYIARAFKAARAADPDAVLAINDFNVEGMNAKSDKLYEIVKGLKEDGVPIDAVGIQAHFPNNGERPSPDEIKQNLQRFADLGVEIHITELDIGQRGGSEEQKQAYHDYVKAFTSNPAVTSITTCGLGDSDSWRSEESPLLFDSNYNPKPAYQGVLDALLNS